MLNGLKTYIVAALMGIATAANYMGWLTDDAYKTIMAFLASLGVATMRSAIANPKGKP